MAKTGRTDPGLFEGLVENIEGGKYLGDRLTVEALVRMTIDEMVANAGPAKSPRVNIAELKSAARKLGSILLGLDPTYVPVSRWNEPGIIDVFAAKWLGSDENTPMRRMEHCIIKLFNELLDVGQFATTPGVLTEQFDQAFDIVVRRYVGVFMGVDLPTQAGLEFEKEGADGK